MKELLRSSRDANAPVKLWGMCCDTNTAAGKLAGKRENTSRSAVGPPVEAAIAMTNLGVRSGALGPDILVGADI